MNLWGINSALSFLEQEAVLKREILELKKEGHTIIFSTHNMASVEEICDNIALINILKWCCKGM